MSLYPNGVEHVIFYRGRNVSLMYEDPDEALKAHESARADPDCIASIVKNGYGIMSPNLAVWERPA